MLSFLTFAILIASSALAATDTSCVISETSCPCTVKASSGTCMRHKGDNTCLLGECSEGYKCDCFAFEQCTRSRCAIFTTLENAVPSVDTPFQCHLTPDAGTCNIFSHFLDTVGAADNAKAEASASIKDSNEDMSETAKRVQDIQADKVTMDEALEEIDVHADKVSEEEHEAVANEVAHVLQAIKQAQDEAMALQEDVAETVKANLQVGRYRRASRLREKEAKEKEAEEKIEAAKPENKEQCNRCEVLKEEVKKLRKERREAAILAGTWTKKVQEAKNRSRKRRSDVKKIRLGAEEARARCIALSNKILDRLRG